MRILRSIAAAGLAATLGTWAAAQTPSTTAQNTTAQSSTVQMIGTPKVEYVDDNSAQIAWSTNAKSSATVHYGTSASALNQTAQAPWGGDTNSSSTVHRVKIQGLQPNTTYYYQVDSAQGQGTGTEAKGQVLSFQTQSKDAATASWRDKQRDVAKIKVGPVIRNVKDTTADIWWMGNNQSATQVKYGASPNNLDQTAQASSLGANEFSANLANLKPSTTYYFELTNGSGANVTKGQFQTESTDIASNPNQFRITGGPNVEYVGQNKAIVAWSTNRRGSSIVRYGTDPNNLTQTAQAAWGGNPHRVTINGLQPNTDYFFVVESSQAEGTGQAAKSQPAPFETVGQGEQAMNAAPFRPNQ
ncbi:MAG: Fibronectin, type [Acidobacteriales bacterium]|nr:Fibronectin, type [Terriglobales bacterium]